MSFESDLRRLDELAEVMAGADCACPRMNGYRLAVVTTVADAVAAEQRFDQCAVTHQVNDAPLVIRLRSVAEVSSNRLAA